jgi:pimeloyl-ACP methyl ester carboxylesterase
VNAFHKVYYESQLIDWKKGPFLNRPVTTIEMMNGMLCRKSIAGPEAVVFIHGLGASKNSFDPGFDQEDLERFTMISLDLPGFGDSPPIKGFPCSMEELARHIEKALDGLRADAYHLIGHSMGGVIGLLLAERLGDRVVTFLNLEGNLGKEDCFFSGKVSSLSMNAFERLGAGVFINMVRRIARQDPSPGIKGYLCDIERADPTTLYLCASSLVQESNKGTLKKRFTSLKARKAYIYGEKTLNQDRLAFFKKNRVPCIVIPDSGHFMMDDRPDLFWPLLTALICNPEGLSNDRPSEDNR